MPAPWKMRLIIWPTGECFTPGEEAYFYSYFDENGVEIQDPTFTLAGRGLEGGEVWFLDSYSRSYPLEDRGRILEYLYAGPEGGICPGL